MKRNSIKIALLAGLLVFGMVSCNKNKILSPNDKVTSALVYSTPAGYKQALAKVYGSFAFTGQQAPASDGDILGSDVGATDFFRLFFNAQELSTDEAVIAYGDPGIQDLHNMVWSSSNFQLQTLYYRSFFQITLCNDFIRQSTDAELASRGITGIDATNVRFYRAEARFLRAYQYWVLMDLFGNPPFITDADAVGSIIPPQTSRAALFTYLESELKAIDPLLVAPMANEYGRVDQAAAWALLSRIYLNAQIYTGTARYTDAITYANKVIAAGYKLIPKFDNMMLADNNLYSVTGGGTVSEFILTINYDGIKTQTYGGPNYLTHAAAGGSVPIVPMGIDFRYGGLRTTSSIVNLFPAPQTTDGSQFPNNGDADTRAQFWYPGQSLVINNETVFTDGIAVTKFRNVTSAGAQGQSPTWPDIDLPLFRLSEQYLIYAEAVLRGGTGGDAATALNYVNSIRTRAYGNATGNITPGQLTTQFILDERGRELMWEGFRRTDLVRYGLFTSGSYVWPFKGGVKNGTAVADFRNIYAIPDADRAVNPNLKQNPGY
jgi:hypothetical protein